MNNLTPHLQLVTPEPRRQVVAIGKWRGKNRQTEEICRVCCYCDEPLSDLDAARLERGARKSHGAHVHCLVEAGFPPPDGPSGGEAA